MTGVWQFGLVAAASVGSLPLGAEPVKPETPVALSIVVSISHPSISGPATLWLLRFGPMAARPVVIAASPGVQLAATGTDGHCPPSSSLAQLKVPETAPNPAVLCVFSAKAQSVRLLASGVDRDGQAQTAQSEVIEFTAESHDPWWKSDIFTTLLSAAVGFLGGLGSTVFGGWLDGFKKRRENRLAGEQFLIKDLFPELKTHATQIREFLAATLAEQQKRCVDPLLQTKLTTAHYGTQVVTFSAYVTSLSDADVLKRFQHYDSLATQYNGRATELLPVAVDARDVKRSVALAGQLRALHLQLGLS